MGTSPARQPPGRPSRWQRRRLLFWALALLLAFPAATPDAAPRASRKGGAEKEAQAFLDGVTALLLPAATTYAQVDWTAATDATAEHIAQRTGVARLNAAL